MNCPVCGGGHTLPLTTGLSRCITTRIHRAPGPGQAGLPGPPVIDTPFTCNTEFADPEVAGIGLRCHGCERDAVGRCVECEAAACGYHSGFHDWSRRLCVAHWEQERDEAAAAAKAIEEDLARRRQALTADAEAAAARVRARRTEIVAEIARVAGLLRAAGSPGAVWADNGARINGPPRRWRAWQVSEEVGFVFHGCPQPTTAVPTSQRYGVSDDGTRLLLYPQQKRFGGTGYNALRVSTQEDTDLDALLRGRLTTFVQSHPDGDAQDGWPATLTDEARRTFLTGVVDDFIRGHEDELAGLRSVAERHGVTV